MRILAIESSCDETSAAVVEQTKLGIQVLSNVTATSLSLHAATGGIIPENAARMQVKYIIPVIIQALVNSTQGVASGGGPPSSDRSEMRTVGRGRSEDRTPKFADWELAKEVLENDIYAIAVTFGPGLIGSLLVGVETAKTLSYVFNKPLIPVNHLLAHIYANFIPTSNFQLQNPVFPFIGLIVSGGHTDLLLFKQHGKYEWLGGTRDDAAGEAFDKIGRLLGLPYPAGPEIERRANLDKKKDIKFKSPILHESNFDFSFSGLKTEVLRFTQKNKLNNETINQICFATQKAILDVLIKKTLKATEKYNCNNILVGGGVSANEMFRQELEDGSLEIGIKTFFPQKQYSTDNAAMIGAYAMLNYKVVDWKNTNANPESYFA